MNIGILGTGNMGKLHAKIFSDIDNVRVAGIFGRNEKKLNDIASSINTKAYTNPYDLITDEDIDVIDVCLPTQLHTEFVIGALNAGKHVFCETPITYTLEDAMAMESASKNNNKLLLVGLFDRFHSQYKGIYDMVRANVLGQIKSVFLNRRSPSYYSGKDIIVNLLIHDIDYIHYLLGNPRAIECNGVISNGIHDHANVLLQYDGISVNIEGNTIMPTSFPFSTSLRVVGEEGAIDLSWKFDKTGPVSEVIIYKDNEEPKLIQISDYDPYRAECLYVVDCILGKADSSLISISTALKSLNTAVIAREKLLSV